jgi:SAM-dependent methyltransferase
VTFFRLNQVLPIVRNWLLAFIAPRPFVGVFGLPRYFRSWAEWSRKGGAPLKFADSHPCLTDWTSTTPFDPHYFYQSAWLARRLAEVKPGRHVDVGSSVGTVGVVSGFVPTLFVDIRPLSTSLSNLTCIDASILALPFEDRSVISLSCLHVIEHIGLGRYGDPLDPIGSERAAQELSRVLSVGGRLFLSAPVGRERVCFNAHRVFAPKSLVGMFESLKLERFGWVDDQGQLHLPASPSDAEAAEYACGFFEFVRQV